MGSEKKSAMSAGADINNRRGPASTTARNGEPGTVDASPPKASEDAHEPEDLVIAEEAEEEYNLRGIKSTIPYTEYRDRRLESKS